MTEFLESMNAFFTFMFSQLTNFSGFLEDTLLGNLLLAGILISFLIFVASIVINFSHK